MAVGKKRVMIVDDSEVDRVVLRSTLENEFEVLEVSSGQDALDILCNGRIHLDGMLLDISMPEMDGFSVLQRMKEKNIRSVPIFLITSEATKVNIEKAAWFNVLEFIRKPFDRDEIIKRLRSRLGVLPEPKLTEEDIQETRRYIAELDAIYRKALSYSGDHSGHYFRLPGLVQILLEEYRDANPDCRLTDAQIEFISKASCFCDIGSLLIPANYRTLTKDEAEKDKIFQSHTILGADMMHLNFSEHCDYFVQVCSDMCAHHHERYDGTGYPHRVIGDNNLIYTQMCRLMEMFDTVFCKYRERGELQFDVVMSALDQDKGFVSAEMYRLLIRSKRRIVAFYNSKDAG